MNIFDYELTSTICQFLDCHLTFPLLEFLVTKELYNDRELLDFILETVNKTNMIDYIMDIRGRLQLSAEMPKELTKRKTDVLAKLKQLKNEVAPIMKATEILKCDETIKDSKTFVNVLQKDYNFQINHLESAYKLAKYLYECGNYQESTSYLYFCLIVMMPTDKNYANVLWGKLAAEILTLNWTSALEDLNRLRDYIDSITCTPIQALQQRTWLIHWALFVFFNHPKGREHIIDMFLYRPFYLNAIETICPHVMRYAAAAVIMNRTKRGALKDLVKVIQQESYSYRDPITEFIESLYVNFDFEKAKVKMHECQTVIINDFFIVGFVHEFIESARLMILETFCQIHHCATIKMLADILNMPPNEAEEWIINLIKNEKLYAQFDSKLGHVVMKSQATPAHQQLVEKIDLLVNRSDQLVGIVDRLAKQKNPEPADAWKYYKN